MLCSRCGALIDSYSARFCPRCGYELNSYTIPIHERRVPETGSAPSYQTQKPKKKKGRSAVVITVAVVIMVFLGLAALGSTIPDEETQQIPSKKTEIQEITEDTYFRLSGDFLSDLDKLSVKLTNDGKIAFTLSERLASDYESYNWKFYDNDAFASTNTYFFSPYTGDSLKKTEPVLYYLNQKAGVYDVSVDCTTPSGEHAAYSGTVEYFGMVEKSYKWTYGSKKYSTDVSFNYKVYLDYKNTNTKGRALTNYTKVSQFVTDEDPVITDLVSSLRTAYGAGGSNLSQDFASFILAFVQICYDYPPYSSMMSADQYQYGVKEYFAFPLETIFYGMGDCEDTSILAAALFKAAGFGAGIVILPEHAVAAVGLSSYTPASYLSSQYELLILPAEDDLLTYYACETTSDRYQAIGLISKVGSGGHPFSWYIGQNDFGLYVV